MQLKNGGSQIKGVCKYCRCVLTWVPSNTLFLRFRTGKFEVSGYEMGNRVWKM
jgi:hypothetical protein